MSVATGPGDQVVDIDVSRPDLVREAFGEDMQSCLGYGVGALLGPGAQPHARRHVDNLAALVDVFEQKTRDEKSPSNIDLDRAPPRLRITVGHLAHLQVDACVVHENVDIAQC